MRGRLQDFSAHLRDIIEQELPDAARVVMPGGDADTIIFATWKVKSDPARPNKRSRMIRVVIPQEATEDYASGSDGVRLASDARLVTWLRVRLGTFDPDHEAPLGVEPPIVTWVISTIELNG